MNMEHIVRAAFGCIFLTVCCGCSGGGGGDDAGSGGLSRGTGTAIRVLHASIDSAPVDLFVNEDANFADVSAIQRALFAKEAYYQRVSDGPAVIKLERANHAGHVVRQISSSLADDTEYTLFMFGSEDSGTFSVSLLPDIMQRPEVGSSFVQSFHSIEGKGELSISYEGGDLGTVAYGQRTQFQQIPSGVHTILVKDGEGDVIKSSSINFPDQGEVTLLVSGSDEFGVTFVTAYNDLD